MTSLLLLATCILVTWLCIWVNEEAPDSQRKWSPFDIRDAPSDSTTTPVSHPGVPQNRPIRQVRSHAGERPWKRRFGS